jgi:hypothetical protein
MADRYDIERERERDRERYRNWEARERERNFGGNRGDWGGSERGWEGGNRPPDWRADRRSENGGLDRGYPEQNREPWGSRSSWGSVDRDWSKEGRREEGPSEGRFGRREDWANYGRPFGRQRDREADWGGYPEDRGRGYDWEHSGTWGSRDAGRPEDFHNENRHIGEEFRSHSGMSYGGGSGSYGGGMGTQGSGRFAGRGPKGWQRSDDRIRDDINERLTRHPDVDATEIDVQVSNGQVTLSGTVDERHARRLAEDIAEGVSGVKEVQNHIRVQQGLISAGHSTPELTAGSGRNMGPQSGRK